MSRETVEHNIDLAKLPPLTEAQKVELEGLAARADLAIDYSNIPPQNDASWQKAVRNPVCRPTRTSTTLRLVTDVLL